MRQTITCILFILVFILHTINYIESSKKIRHLNKVNFELTDEVNILQGEYKDLGENYLIVRVVQRFIEEENNSIPSEEAFNIAFLNVRYATKYDIPITYLLAVQRTESVFNVNAVSKKGAIGLNQLHGNTAEWLLGELGYEYNRENIFNPQINIESACYYIRFLLDEFGDFDRVSIVFNGGYKQLAKYIAKKNLALETRDYLSKIQYFQTKADKFINSNMITTSN